jgi:uncharacterized membrane protein YkvA (DUF1232 family)
VMGNKKNHSKEKEIEMVEQVPENEFSKEYSEEKFWDKVKKYAIKAGKTVIVSALIMFHTMKDKDTPIWAKSVIVGALGYFICPYDAIPDMTPVIGYVDDLGVLAAAMATVALYIKPEHRQKAEDTWKGWFGDMGQEPTD